jgi:hypothetical protein
MANLENIITEVIKPIEALLGTYGDSGLAAEAMYPKLKRFTPAALRAGTNKVLSEWTQRTKKPLAPDIAKAVVALKEENAGKPGKGVKWYRLQITDRGYVTWWPAVCGKLALDPAKELDFGRLSGWYNVPGEFVESGGDWEQAKFAIEAAE